MNQFEKRIAACDEKLREHASEYKSILDKAKEEDRQPTEDDRAAITEHMQAIETLKAEKAETEKNLKTYLEMEDLSRNLGPQFSDFNRDVEVVEKSPEEVKSLGEQFIESKGYKDLLERGLTGEFATGPVELDTKAVLYETPGTALTPREYQPGVVQTLFQPNYLGDLIPNIQTNASQVTYVNESTATNAAAAVAEGQAKPQSTLVFSEVTEPVRKLATILPVSEEMLADAPQIQAYINSRLTLFIKNTEEVQLLRGSGTAPNIQGFIAAGRTSVGTYYKTAAQDNARAILTAATGARGSSFLNPDAIVMHPDNWLTIRAGTDASGQYYGGGPFFGPYGGPQGPASANYFSTDNLWGLPVYVTSNINAGTALVGAFREGAAIYRRSGVTVDATNSHSTWFADNITALRAEERLALAVYRQTAFSVVGSLA